MTRPEVVLDRIRRLDAQTAATRAKLGILADARAEVVGELRALVGTEEAARLLGVSKHAIYKAQQRSRKEVN